MTAEFSYSEEDVVKAIAEALDQQRFNSPESWLVTD